jgi:drug/metabolite transporter (DMT)-like permease
VTPLRKASLTSLALAAFAGNSLFCRAALRSSRLDFVSFTSLRLVSGALVLLLLVRLRGGKREGGGSWGSAAALFLYAIAFSAAYLTLTAGTGALLLFGAVQATMLGHALLLGERFRRLQFAGLLVALGGLVGLLLPGLSAPPLWGALLMVFAGAAWGIYSLRGRVKPASLGDPLLVTAGNFARAAPAALLLSGLLWQRAVPDAAGALYAVASGGLTSGLGYALWYSVVPSMQSSQAAALQLLVPVLAGFGSVFLLGEPLTLRLVLAALAIIGGIALVIRGR